MRDFSQYIKKSKEDNINHIDYYMEGFSSDLLKMEGMDPVKAFILGFLAGKDINISKNKEQLSKLLEKDKIESTTQAISNFTIEGKEYDLKALRTSLAKALVAFRTIFKHKKQEEDDGMQPTLFDVEKYRK
jgi:uncharacterized ubiquitin-like protein YukD